MTGDPHRRQLNLSRRSVLRGAAAIGAAGLAGCGRGLGGGSSSQDSSLQMMIWGEGNQTTFIVEAIKDWEAQDGKTKISTQYGPLNGYYDKLATRVAGGNAPDIFQLSLPFLDDYLARDTIMALDDHAEDLGLTKVPSSIEPTIKQDGHYYLALMGAATQPAVVYDTTRLDSYKVQPPAQDWTLRDFEQAARQIRKQSKDSIYGATDGGGSSVQLESYVRGLGAALFDADGKLAITRDQFTDWLQLWDSMRKNGSCPPMKITSAGTGFQNDPLVKGNAAFTMPATSRGYPTLQALTKHKLGLGRAPRTTPDSKPGTNIIPNGWFAISKKCKNPEKAVALLKYLSQDPKAITTMGLSRGVPLSAAQRDAVKGQLKAPDKIVFDNYLSVADADLTPLQLYPAGSSSLMATSLPNANETVGFGKATIKQATDQFFNDARRMLG